MALAQTQRNSTGVQHRASGEFSGTYTADATYTLTLGFSPTYFRLVNSTTGLSYEWYKGFASGDYLLDTWSSGVITKPTDDKIVVDEDAGTVTILGGSGDIITDDDSVSWFAVG